MSYTQTGMQQKEGTNMVGPAPVEVQATGAYAAGAFAKLATSLATSEMKPAAPKKAAVTEPAVPFVRAAVPVVATAVSTLPDHPSLSIVVLDSGALISSGSVSLHATSAGFELLARIYRENDGKTRFVTTQAVLNELRDEKTRQMMAALPFQIEVLAVDPEAVRECYRFATLTGDAKVLSATDIQIVALHYQLEKQHNGMMFIKTEPRRSKAMDAINAAATEAAAPAAATPAAASSSDAVSSDAASADAAAPVDPTGHEECESDDDEEAAPAEADASSTSAVAAAAAPVDAAEAPKSDLAAAAAAAFAGDENDNDGEGAWITPASLAARKAALPVKPTEPESSIAVITTDYAMQNVLLQLGLRLLNIRGRSIKSIRSWQKKCHACFQLCPDMSKEFCSNCGGHTLIRVNVTVSKAGLVRYWHGTRHLNLRGTIYSIPMPRAGRHAQNLKLSEDVIDERIRKGGGLMGRTGDGGKNREKTPKQLFEDGVEFGIGRTGPQGNEHVFGYGRKNPNAQKQGGGKKKGKK